MNNNLDEGIPTDLLIVMDTTASMSPYIESAKNSIIEICTMLHASVRLARKGALRVGLLEYWDYTPGETEEKDSVIRFYPFTEDLKKMKEYLTHVVAQGGDDYPEAFGTALECAYEMWYWREEAMKAIIVVTDAAPHGINEEGDNFPDGGPRDTNIRDPLQVAKDIAKKGFSIFVLGCEPTLAKTTKYAIEFYRAISTLTFGAFCSLTDSNLLATMMIGVVLERLDLKKLCLQHRETIQRRLFVERRPFDEVVKEVHGMLSDQNAQVTTIKAQSVYNNLPGAAENYQKFLRSESLAEAKLGLKEVMGAHLDRRAEQALEEYKRKQDPGFSVTVFFKNTGGKAMELLLFDSNRVEFIENTVIQGGHTIIKEFRINVAVNFTIICGGRRKYFSRIFNEGIDIDIDQMFNNLPG